MSPLPSFSVNYQYNNCWFQRERVRLLKAPTLSEIADRRMQRVTATLRESCARAVAVAQKDRDNFSRALKHCAPMHADAVRGHTQFLRACLESTTLPPSDALVAAIATVEWNWFTTPLKDFYRDHLSHVMKVTTIALQMLECPEQREGEPRTLGEFIAGNLASGAWGADALRRRATQLGVTDEQLSRVDWWHAVLRESIRVGGLLHDLDYPSMMARKIAAASQPSNFALPWQNAISPQAVEAIEGTLLITPFTHGVLPRRKMANEEREICERIISLTHSLPAGIRILEFGNEADTVIELTPTERFIVEWAALAASMHDYDKLWAKSHVERDPLLWRWLGGGTNNANHASVSPNLRLDPASFFVAMGDQLQDFGRMHYETGRVTANGAEDGADWESTHTASFPVREVRLESSGRTLSLSWAYDLAQPSRDKHSASKARRLKSVTNTIGPGKWLDFSPLFDSVNVQVG